MVTHITSSKQKLYWSEVGIQDKDQSRWFNQQIQARLVVKGYKQKEGEDFKENFCSSFKTRHCLANNFTYSSKELEDLSDRC